LANPQRFLFWKHLDVSVVLRATSLGEGPQKEGKVQGSGTLACLSCVAVWLEDSFNARGFSSANLNGF